MTTLQLTTDYAVLICSRIGCGMQFAVPNGWYKKRLEDHAGFYCPNGHPLHFGGESRAEKAERLLRDRTASLDFQREKNATLERSRNALRGVVTRTKNRISRGVCPCCSRHFMNLERHMAAKHPEYASGSSD